MIQAISISLVKSWHRPFSFSNTLGTARSHPASSTKVELHHWMGYSAFASARLAFASTSISYALLLSAAVLHLQYHLKLDASPTLHLQTKGVVLPYRPEQLLSFRSLYRACICKHSCSRLLPCILQIALKLEANCRIFATAHSTPLTTRVSALLLVWEVDLCEYLL